MTVEAISELDLYLYLYLYLYYMYHSARRGTPCSSAPTHGRRGRRDDSDPAGIGRGRGDEPRVTFGPNASAGEQAR
jgi:hypothetical protein